MGAAPRWRSEEEPAVALGSVACADRELAVFKERQRGAGGLSSPCPSS